MCVVIVGGAGRLGSENDTVDGTRWGIVNVFNRCRTVYSSSEVVCCSRVYLILVGRSAGPPPTALCRRGLLDLCGFRQIVVDGVRVAISIQASVDGEECCRLGVRRSVDRKACKADWAIQWVFFVIGLQ